LRADLLRLRFRPACPRVCRPRSVSDRRSGLLPRTGIPEHRHLLRLAVAKAPAVRVSVAGTVTRKWLCSSFLRPHRRSSGLGSVLFAPPWPGPQRLEEPVLRGSGTEAPSPNRRPVLGSFDGPCARQGERLDKPWEPSVPPVSALPRQRFDARHAAGNRRRLPWSSAPLGEISSGGRDTSVCLTDAIRSQGFSPSQRFDPARASWLCFTPHPPTGFRPSELFPLSQSLRLSTPVALMSLGQLHAFRTSRLALRPRSWTIRPDLPHAKTEPLTSARATLHHNLGINRARRRPRVVAVLGERLRPRQRASTQSFGQGGPRFCERSFGEPRPGHGPRLQSLAPTERPYSSPRCSRVEKPMLS
jgi:hypothetical protein